jgi:hypothetical protein
MNITLDHRATPRLPKATKTYPTAPTQRYNSIHTERKTTQVHGIEARALIIKNHDCFLFALLEMKIRQNSYFIPFPSSSPGTIYGLRILDSFGSRNDFFFSAFFLFFGHYIAHNFLRFSFSPSLHPRFCELLFIAAPGV